MTNWTQQIPARVRSTLYIVFGAASLALTAVTAWSGAVGTTAPTWTLGAAAVLGVIGGAFGFTAAGNTNVTGLSPTDIGDPDDSPVIGEDIPAGTDDGVDLETDETPVPDDYQPRHSA